MNCETAQELLSASLDGELTPAEEAQLQAHLDQCPNCRALQTELSDLHKAFGEMDVLPPAQLKEQIMANLPPQRPAKVLYWKRWGAMAAALALVALAAWRLPHSLYEKSDAQQAEITTVVSDCMDTVQGRANPAEAASADAEDDGPAGCMPEDAAVDSAATAPDLNARAVQDIQAAGGGSASTAGPDGGELQDDAMTPAAASLLQGRMALRGLPSDPVYAIDGEDTKAVPEAVPNPDETPVSAQPFEAVTEDRRDLSRYRAVITLGEAGFEGDYPRQRQENGDMWYLLPLSELENVSQTLDQTGLSYELRLEGEDLTPDAPYVLLVVPGAN